MSKREYIVLQGTESGGANMTFLDRVKAKNPKKAVEKVTGRSVKEDTYMNAPEVAYTAVAASNWNRFR